MLRPNHDEQLVPRHRLAGKAPALDGAFDEAQLRRAVFDRRRNLRGVADGQADLDFRIALS